MEKTGIRYFTVLSLEELAGRERWKLLGSLWNESLCYFLRKYKTSDINIEIIPTHKNKAYIGLWVVKFKFSSFKPHIDVQVK